MKVDQSIQEYASIRVALDEAEARLQQREQAVQRAEERATKARERLRDAEARYRALQTKLLDAMCRLDPETVQIAGARKLLKLKRDIPGLDNARHCMCRGSEFLTLGMVGDRYLTVSMAGKAVVIGPEEADVYRPAYAAAIHSLMSKGFDPPKSWEGEDE